MASVLADWLTSRMSYRVLFILPPEKPDATHGNITLARFPDKQRGHPKDSARSRIPYLAVARLCLAGRSRYDLQVPRPGWHDGLRRSPAGGAADQDFRGPALLAEPA